jgi:hypothetical protein
LVVHVTHNHDLVPQFADRVIEMRSGRIEKDTSVKTQFSDADTEKIVAELDNLIGDKRAKMSLRQFAPLVLKNINARRLVALFAGIVMTVGITAIAFLLAVETGFSKKVNELKDEVSRVEPITISTGGGSANGYFNELYYDNQNVITPEFVSNTVGKIAPEDVQFIWQKRILDMHLVSSRRIVEESITFQPMPPTDITKKYYEKIAGEWPVNKFDVLLVVDGDKVPANLSVAFNNYKSDISFDDFMALQPGAELELIPNNFFYEPDYYGSRKYRARSDFPTYGHGVGKKLNISGVVKKSGSLSFLKPGLAFTDDLYAEMQNIESQSDIVRDQLAAFANGGTASVLWGRYPVVAAADRSATLKMMGADSGVFEIAIYMTGLDAKNRVVDLLTAARGIKFVDNTDELIESTLRHGNAFVKIMWVVAGACVLSASALFFGLVYQVERKRTKEIGIVRAVGARNGDVFTVLLLEVGLLGLISGLLSVALNAILVAFGNPILSELVGLAGKIAFVAWWQPLAVIMFGLGISVLAGLVPIAIAMRVSTIKAIQQF